MFVLVSHPYINNFAFFIVVYLFKGNWLLEIAMILFVLSIIVINLQSIRLVSRYIYKNNKWWLIPFVMARAGLIILFQFLTNQEITFNLKNGRKTILFPGCIVSRMFLYTETPDKTEIELLRKDINKNSIFLDIGANIGSYSILLSDLTKNIFAFEPSPISSTRCKKNYLKNNLNVSNVNTLALSNKRGVSGFTDYGGSSTVNKLSEGADAKIMVKTDSLDNWVRKNIKNKNII